MVHEQIDFICCSGEDYVMSSDPILSLWFLGRSGPGTSLNIFSLPGFNSLRTQIFEFFKVLSLKIKGESPGAFQYTCGGKQMLELGICFEPENCSIKFLHDPI